MRQMFFTITKMYFLDTRGPVPTQATFSQGASSYFGFLYILLDLDVELLPFLFSNFSY